MFLQGMIYLQHLLVVSLFFFPICLITKEKDSRLFLYAGLTAVLCSFLYQFLYALISKIQVESMGIYSIISFICLNGWYLYRGLKVKGWLETVLSTHCEVMIMLQFLPAFELEIAQGQLITSILRVIGIGLLLFLLTPVNRRLVAVTEKKYLKILLNVLLSTALFALYWRELGIYFTPADHVHIDQVPLNEEQFMYPAPSLIDEIKKALVYSFLFCIGIAVAIIVVAKERIATRRLKETIVRENQLKSYIDTIEAMQADIRKIHHDYNNLILTFGGYLYDDQVDADGLRVLYAKISEVKTDTTLASIYLSKLNKIDDLELKSLLTTKLVHASQLGIEVKVEIDQKINSIPIDTIDLLRIIGNLLDNAIEACQACQKPMLTVAFIVMKDHHLLIVENSTNAVSLSLEEIKCSGVSTKGTKRGLGVSNILEILSAYPEVDLETTLEGSLFRQTLVYR